ncbi:EAL domain-containing protein [Citrobacter meridianamericanus]|uniref:EAL domain-containing protein n=1 Tax=Citrobacter meridianamericanus TaxID=2894201 RepID=UPI00351D0654
MVELLALWLPKSGNLLVSLNVLVTILQYPELLMACRYFIQNTPENNSLTFELTECRRLSFTKAKCHNARELKSSGVLLRLDNFGTEHLDFLALNNDLFDTINILGNLSPHSAVAQ